MANREREEIWNGPRPRARIITDTWLIPGPYTGLGPQGYRVSDEHILDDVYYRLTQHGQIDASDIQAAVDQGEVTLTGSVHDRRQKRLAEDIAYSVPGVIDVINQVRVQQVSSQRGARPEEQSQSRRGGRAEESRNEKTGQRQMERQGSQQAEKSGEQKDDH